MLPSTSAFTIRPLICGDIAALAPVLRQHIRDLHSGAVVESEVQAIMGYMEGSSDTGGRQRRYLVATAATGTVLACMAWAPPDALMAQHFAATGVADGSAVELLNAFVASAHLGGKGIGRALFDAICAQARDAGAAWLLVNSGPRYRHSWGFYDRVGDSSHGFIDNYYGPGRHAKTWRKALLTAAT
jgi:GNAT superfamily N-acetyltransferase